MIQVRIEQNTMHTPASLKGALLGGQDIRNPQGCISSKVS